MRTFAGILLLLGPAALTAQTQQPGYTFQVQVDEVTLPFRAVGVDGRPVTDLQREDFYLRDNGKEPKKILSFSHLTDQPIHTGILLDVSASIEGSALYWSQDIASLFAGDFFRPSTDEAFAMKFDFDQKFLSGWINHPAAIQSAISAVGNERNSRMGGTAIYDALYRAIRDQIAQQTAPGQGSNAILLFSDGDDNASHARFSDVIDICQKTNTTIYVFSSNPHSHFDAGEKNLRDLVAQSGGRIFYDRDAAGVRHDLQTIEDDLRDYYLVVYKPAALKPNGAFHRIRLECLRKGVAMNARAGYLAPRASR
jgi:VWFA-related protein